MRASIATIAVTTIAVTWTLAGPVEAQLLQRKDMSLATALTIAQTASETCKATGYQVSVHVVGRLGEPIVALRGDYANPHTFENSMRKAYTARTFRVASGEIEQRLKDNPGLPQIHLTNVIANRGGLPIKIGDDIIGAVGVSGAPGGDKDETCAKAGIDKAAAQLQ